MKDLLVGGCQCGAIRFEAKSAPIVVALCHCAMCRRAKAAPADALAPSLHYWDSKRLPWIKFADDLPRHAEFPPFE